jgi:DNA-binding transcriptional LysR family regulator
MLEEYSMARAPETTLNQLRYFATLAQELHFGRAAQQIGISQPALTRQIQSLEKIVGAPLVERTGRAISLTAAGRVFAEHARDTLRGHDRAMEAARNTGQRHEQSLAIGFESCAPFHNLASVVLQYLRRYPQTRFSSFVMPAPEQAEGLARRRIDLGFVHPPVSEPERFAFEPVGEDRFILALPDSHPLAARKRVRLSELKKERWVFYPRHLAPACYDAVHRICEAGGFRPEVVHESNGVSVSLSLIPALGAVTLFPECVRNQKAEGVVYRELEGKNAAVTCGFLRRIDERSTAAERFLKLWRAMGQTQSRGQAARRIIG